MKLMVMRMTRDMAKLDTQAWVYFMMSKLRLPKDSFRQKISRNSLTSEMTNFDNCFDNCCQREVKEMSKIRSTCQRFSLTTSNVKIFLQGLNFFHWMCPDFLSVGSTTNLSKQPPTQPQPTPPNHTTSVSSLRSAYPG